jgi:hypothetical protein
MVLFLPGRPKVDEGQGQKAEETEKATQEKAVFGDYG